MESLPQRHGTARRAERPSVHLRPPGLSDLSVVALGSLSEALEAVEQARGALYEFHRLSGRGDLTLARAVSQLRDAGHVELADEIAECLVGRDVIDGRWTFQLVEAYDDQYWSVFRDVERTARERLGAVPRHLYEAEMKRNEQSGLTQSSTKTEESAR